MDVVLSYSYTRCPREIVPLEEVCPYPKGTFFSRTYCRVIFGIVINFDHINYDEFDFDEIHFDAINFD